MWQGAIIYTEIVICVCVYVREGDRESNQEDWENIFHFKP